MAAPGALVLAEWRTSGRTACAALVTIKHGAGAARAQQERHSPCACVVCESRRGARARGGDRANEYRV